MNTDNLTTEPSNIFALKCRRWGVGERTYPYRLDPRRLGETLVEFSTGGAWRVEDVEADITFTAPAGRVFAVPAERLHSLTMVRGRPMHSNWNFVALEDQIGRDAFMSIPRALLLLPKASAAAIKVLLRLQRSCTDGTRGSPFAGVGGVVARQRLALELAAIILDASPSPVTPLRRLADERIERVLQFIHDHLAEPLTRDDLARHVHLSPTRFHYVFGKATGQPPMQYLLIQRLRRARQLLLSDSISSKEVGQLCGFVNATHFSRTFTRFTSISPTEYRDQMHDRSPIMRANVK